MAFYEHSQDTLRATAYDKTVKQLASYAYKFKQLVSVVSGASWNNYFFREQLTVLSGATGNATKGIPRGAEFPHASLSWERVLATIQKYGLEDSIPYEDIVSNEIDVRDRTLVRIAEGVAKAVDDEICLSLAENYSIVNINTGVKQGGYWTESSAAIVKDLAKMKAQIRAYYNNVDSFVVVVHPDNEVNILSYLYDKGAQAPTVGADMALNGEVGKVAGVNVVVSTSISPSYALMVVPQRCATWKELLPLGTDVVENKFKSTKITACEMGVTQLTDPKAVVLLQCVK